MDIDSIANFGKRFTIDLERIRERMEFFTDGKLPFVMYENGTCVFAKEKDRDAIRTIASAAFDVLRVSQLDFTVRDMKDGNYFVTFTKLVHALVLRAEFERDRPFIETHESQLNLPSEVIASPPGISRIHRLVGLYARARLFADLRDRNVSGTTVPGLSMNDDTAKTGFTSPSR